MKKINLYLSIIIISIFSRCSENDLIVPAATSPDSTNITADTSNADELKTASTGPTLYISTTGNDTGDGSSAKPWKTLRYAITKVPANQNYTLKLSAGTFIESDQIIVPTGVSIMGAGKTLTIIKGSSSFYYHPTSPGYSTNKFLFSLSSASPTGGNQALSNFTIEGDSKQLHGGIYVFNRNNITIDAVKVQNTNFSGIWLWSVNDSQVINTDLTNCAWGSASYCSGALNLGNLTRVDIGQLNVNEGTGYGIKAIGPSGNNNINNVKIHDSRISVAPTGIWNGGSAPNIAIELWSVNLVSNEIYNTYVDNTISLVNSSALPSTGVQTIRVHHNTIDIDTRAKGAGYGIELTVHDAEVDHNYFIKGTNGIANWDVAKQNWNIHHNTFYALQGQYPGEVVRSQKSGLHNVKLYNNTVEFEGTKTMNVVGLYGGASDNVLIQNNLFINSNTAYSYYPNSLVHTENGATLSLLTVKNNLFNNLPVGSISGTYLNNLTSDPMIAKTGSRPDAYYAPKTGSPLINTGLNLGFIFSGSAPDIGAIESGNATNSSPQVSITSPVGGASFTTGSSAAIAVNATDSDGTISKVEFYSGSTLLGQDIASPYSFSWANLQPGNYSLTAKATDNAGAFVTSSPVSITVSASANVLPTVSLTAPSTNSSLTTGASVTLTANASDNDGTISKVEFYNGTTLLGQDVTSPYSLAWTATTGNCNISAKATDNSGASVASSAALVTVSSTIVTLNLDSSDATLSGLMTTGSDAKAQRGTYFYIPAGSGKNYVVPPPAAAVFNIQVSKTDKYVIWAKVKSLSTTNKGYFVYNGSGKWFTWLAGIHTDWTWVKITESGTTTLFPFVQGSNQFKMAWYDENVALDQILITNNTSFIP